MAVIAEFVIAGIHPPYDSFLEQWGTGIADAVIAFGIIGEVLFSARDGKIQTELRKRSNDKLAEASERAAEANNKAELLQSENLTMHRVMIARHIGIIGIDGPPPAQVWFAGMQAFAGTDVLIQFANEAEAQNLANEIALALSVCGWKPQFTDETESHVSLALSEGVSVMTPQLDNRPWTAEDLELVPYTHWAHAGDALARTLTAAGLGVSNFPVNCIRLPIRPNKTALRSQITPWFDPPLAAVYVQVGARPISLTLQWLANQRKSASPQ